MNCPECGAWSVILETRSSTARYRRRRECANGHKFTTEEIVVSQEQIKTERSDRFSVVREKRVESVRAGRSKNIGNAS
jgi:transcriptional regulator NrdR family protein